MSVIQFRPKTPQAKQPPAFNIPPYTLGLTLVLVGVYGATLVLPNNILNEFYNVLAFVPARLLAGDVKGLTGIFGYGFLHAGFMHLAMNLVMLLALGAQIEQALDGKRMLILCLLGTIAGALAQTLVNIHATDPMIGASAAIGGLFGALVMLQPTPDMRRKMAAALGLMFVGTAFLFGMVMGGSTIAWAAHLGGMLAGMVQTGLWLGRRL